MHFRKPSSTESDSSARTRRKGRAQRHDRQKEFTLSQADLDLLPEKDYSHYASLSDVELLKQAKSLGIGANGLAREHLLEA